MGGTDATATDTEIGTAVDSEKVRRNRVSWDEEAQIDRRRVHACGTVPRGPPGLWRRFSDSVHRGVRSATAAMQWSASSPSTSVSSGTSGTSYTSTSYTEPRRPRIKGRTSTSGTRHARAGVGTEGAGLGVDGGDARDRTPVSLVVVEGGSVRTKPDANEASDANRRDDVDEERAAQVTAEPNHNDTPVASRYDRSGARGIVGRAWALATHLLLRKAWPTFKDYCDSSFPDARQEENFQREAWYAEKTPALLCSLFLVVEYTLILGLMTPANDFYTYWSYVVIIGVVTLPMPVMILFNGPQRFNWVYQFFVLGAGWSFGYLVSIEMHGPDMSMCMVRATTFIMGPLFALPTLTLLAMRQNRMLNLLAAIAWAVFASLTIMFLPGSTLASTRTVFDFTLYHMFLTYLHYTRERAERQTFLLRQELKNQCKAAQSAQEMERRANQSKKRFVSYIFHEVRVPLNTALLAVQNLEGEGVFRDLSEDHTDMIYGLMGSLNVMEKVLNDVLSFNRMDSGKFTLESVPLDLHKALHVVAMSHRPQAERAGVGFALKLDPRIDALPGTLMGDDMRLRQVLSNLVSNALKFTEAGSVTIVTRLVLPHAADHVDYVEEPYPESARIASTSPPPAPTPPVGQGGGAPSTPPSPAPSPPPVARPDPESAAVSATSDPPAPRVLPAPTAPPPMSVVIRVEVHDTGVGLSSADLTGNSLFSPYVQTEIGRRQGGKGSGLGLALVRQIVTLSKGRLGVKSQVGKGSIFWFEIPYTLVPSQGDHTTPKTPLSVLLDRGGGALTSPSVVTLTLPLERPSAPQTPGIGVAVETPPGFAMETLTGFAMETPPVDLPPGKAGTLAIHPSPSADVQPELSPLSAVTLSPPISDASGRPLLESAVPRPRSEFEPEPAEQGTAAACRPTRAQPDRAPEREQPESADGDTRPLNALVVDDDPLTRKLMSRMLTRLGQNVVGTAENGVLALDLIRASFEGRAGASAIDIVFLDNQMPAMSGVEVTHALRALGCTVFIVGCTGNALREDQDEYLSAGADGLITKPISQVRVLAMLEQARARRRAMED